MKPDSSPWQRLVAAARASKDEADFSAPYGFSARLVAQGINPTSRSRSAQGVFARVSWPALGIAALAAVVAVATNLKPMLSTYSEDVSALAEPVSADLDVSA